MDWKIVLDALKGAGLGLFTVLLSWSKKQDVDKFNWKGLAVRVPIGIIVGAMAGVLEVPFNEAHEMAAGIGLIYVLDHIAKLIMRRIPFLNKLKKKEEKKKLSL